MTTSLQSLINAANAGDTITLSGDYADSATVTITKSLTIVGRATSGSGSRPTLTVSTAAEQAGISINASNVTLRGFTLVHNYATIGSTTTAINLLPGGTAVYPDAGSMTNENIEIDDCKIDYGKFGVTSKAKNFSVVGCVLHCRIATNSTARAIAVYSQDGLVTVLNNTYTTAGNLAIEGIHHNFATNDSYVNKRNGKLSYVGNSNNFSTSRKWIFFEVGSEKGVPGDKYEMDISNNTITATGSSFVVIQPNSLDSFSYFTSITINNNTIPATFTNGVLQIDYAFGTVKTFTMPDTTPLFFANGNTTQTGIVTTNKVVVQNFLVFTSTTSVPEGYENLLSMAAAATAPSVTSTTGGGSVTEGGSITFTVDATGTDPLTYQWTKGGSNISGATSSSYTIASTTTSDTGSYAVVVTNSAGSATSSPISLTVNNSIAVATNSTSNQGTVSLNISQLVGGGSISGSVTVKKFSPNSVSAETTATINSLTNRLILVNSATIPYQKILSVFPNTWRGTIGGKLAPVSFSVKFVDGGDLTQLVSSPGTQNYTIELPEMANRQYVNIYKENPNDTTTFITQASLVSGQTYIYSFNLSNNSVYTIADSGVMVLGPGMGSDPHITTIRGEHRVMNKIRGKNRTFNILSDDRISIRGHVQGYKLGDYLSHVRIANDGDEICEIDFNHKKVNIKNNELIKTVGKVDSSNLTNSVNSNKLRQMVHLKGLNPGGVYLYIDFNQRYVCPVFNQVIQNKSLTGLLI